MPGPDKKFYMVREDILPESILKTAEAKEKLARGDALNIQQAVDGVGIARSTFYKYKDGVFALFNAENFEIVNISLLLKHMPGILSAVLNHIAKLNGNILTINQNLPMHGVAYLTISISVQEMTVSVDKLLANLAELDGVLEVEVVGKS
ncbi:MAG: ACT domain-containing protein [Syntrophomonadaceae bacterium]|jgi:chorismate mutase|nr:ACT domain-containing protein [Syntrophomonadaceae bacterium]